MEQAHDSNLSQVSHTGNRQVETSLIDVVAPVLLLTLLPRSFLIGQSGSGCNIGRTCRFPIWLTLLRFESQVVPRHCHSCMLLPLQVWWKNTRPKNYFCGHKISYDILLYFDCIQ